GELIEFRCGIIRQLLPFLSDESPLAVALTAHRDVLAERHRDRPSDESGDAGGEQGGRFARRASHADDQRSDRNDAVIRPQHARTEPVQTPGEVAAVRLIWMSAGYGMRRDGHEGIQTLVRGRGWCESRKHT